MRSPLSARSAGVLACAVLMASAFVVTGRAHSTHAAQPVDIAQQLAVPAYVNPLADPAAWLRLASSTPGSLGFAVVNVINGPDYVAQDEWTSAIKNASASGVKLVGYVDTGFAPVKSLIEHALALDAAPSLSLFWLATRSDGHFLANQCRSWSEALDQFEVALSMNPDAARGAREIAVAMRVDLFDIDCDFYLAGPREFVQVLQEELRSAGVPAAQLFVEVLELEAVECRA